MWRAYADVPLEAMWLGQDSGKPRRFSTRCTMEPAPWMLPSRKPSKNLPVPCEPLHSQTSWQD